ncbi:MAG: hypothetical protein ACO3O0_03965 [Bacteroidia bacterium]
MAYYKNKLNETNQFYEMFLIEQKLINDDYGMVQPRVPDEIMEIGNVKIYAHSTLINPDAEEGHDFEYDTKFSYYLKSNNTYAPVNLEECFNSKQDALLKIISNKINEILKNPDELDPCGMVKQSVKLPIRLNDLKFFVDQNQCCFQFAETSLCGGETEICFTNEEMLQYLK